MNQIKKIHDTTYEGKPFVTWVRNQSSLNDQTTITVYVLLEIPPNHIFSEPQKTENDYKIELTPKEGTNLGVHLFKIQTFENEIAEAFNISVYRNGHIPHQVTIGEIGPKESEPIVPPEYIAAPFVFPEFDPHSQSKKITRIHCAVILPPTSTAHLIKEDTENLEFNYSIEKELSPFCNEVYHYNTFSITSGTTIDQASFSVLKNGKRKKVLVSTKDGTVNQDLKS